MGVSSNTSPQDRSGMLFLRAHPHIANALPTDSDLRLREEFHEHVRERFDKLYEYGIIERVHIDEHADTGSTRWYWRVPPTVATHAQRYTVDGTLTPCGRTGVSTIEPGETYSCTSDDCDCRFSRDRAEEVLG